MATIKKKFIGADQVDGNKILFDYNQNLRTRDSGGIPLDAIELGDSVNVKLPLQARTISLDAGSGPDQNDNLIVLSRSGTGSIGIIGTDQQIPGGGTVRVGIKGLFESGATGSVALFSDNYDTNSGGSSGEVSLLTGDLPKGPGNSGNIKIKTGNVVHQFGIPGDIVIEGGVSSFDPTMRGNITITGKTVNMSGCETLDLQGVNVLGLPASGANTTLSNLDYPVAVNMPLTPSSDGNVDFGANTNKWRTGWINFLNAQAVGIYDGATKWGNIITRGNIPSGGTVDIALNTEGQLNGSIGVYTSIGFSSDSGNIYIESGTKNGPGKSGDLLFKTGSALDVGGFSGDILLETGGTDDADNRGDIKLLADTVDMTGSHNLDLTGVNVIGLTPGGSQARREKVIITPTIVAEQKITLLHTPDPNSVMFFVIGGALQDEDVDYEVNGDEISFIVGGSIEQSGPAALQANDVVYITYTA